MSKIFCRKCYRRLNYLITFVLLLLSGITVAQPGSGRIYFKEISTGETREEQKGEIRIAIYAAVKNDTFSLIDSIGIHPEDTTLVSLSKGKGTHKIVVIKGDKTMQIVIRNLKWGEDYGLLELGFKKGKFHINENGIENEERNSACACIDLSQKLIPK